MSATDYSHKTPFGEEASKFSVSDWVGVDYEVSDDEFLK